MSAAQTTMVRKPRKKGRPAHLPIGRKKGVPNNINRDVKEMMFEALNRVGGAAYLAKRAIDTPASFMALLGKMMPAHMVGGDAGSLMLLHLDAAQMVSQQLLEERAAQAEPQQDRHLTIDHAELPKE